MGGGHADRAVYPAEVVERETESRDRPQILELLAEPVGEARESPHPHARRQVEALDVARGNVVPLGLADDGDLSEAYARGASIFKLT